MLTLYNLFPVRHTQGQNGSSPQGTLYITKGIDVPTKEIQQQINQRSLHTEILRTQMWTKIEFKDLFLIASAG